MAQNDVEPFDEYAEKWRLEGKIAEGGMQGGVDVYVSSVAKGPHDQTLKGNYSVGRWLLLFISSNYRKKQLALEKEHSFVVLRSLGLGGLVGMDGSEGPGELLKPEDDAKQFVLILSRVQRNQASPGMVLL